mgnify:CR=1 FL=1
MEYTCIFQSKDKGNLKLPQDFIFTSSVLKSMIEDTDETNEIVILDKDVEYLSRENLEMLNSVFQRTKTIEIEGTNYVDFIQTRFKELKTNYADYNRPLPNEEEFIKIESEIMQAKLRELLMICDYFDMKIIQKILGIIYSYKLKKMTNYKEKVREYIRMRVKIGHITKEAFNHEYFNENN